MGGSEYFFQVGGALTDDAPSYIERPADSELLIALERGELCLVLAPRQTGKSSLMVHVRSKLLGRGTRDGTRAGIVDLQPLGSQTQANQWFGDVTYQIERSLRLNTNTQEWWTRHRNLGPTQRFMTFLEDVVLTETEGPVTLFFDEIDSVFKLPFSDDFFTTLRALYNARATNRQLRRLTFVLLGVATPVHFIRDPSRTPFNVGRLIELADFERTSAESFCKLFDNDLSGLVDRIFHWTNGQPFLVQNLAAKAYDWTPKERTVKRLDLTVRSLFLEKRIEHDTHLKSIQDYLLGFSDAYAVLQTYDRILQGDEMTADEQSMVHSCLKLSGIIQERNGKLCLRNRIYRFAFDSEWIRENLLKIKHYPQPKPLLAHHKMQQALARDEALSEWREKLEFLLMEEARLSDPNGKFAVRKLIQEAEGKIRELSVASSPSPPPRDAESERHNRRLKELYRRKKELTLAGDDTAAVLKEIIGVRRLLHRGPILQSGDLLADGRFELHEKIGQGGFATVWKAWDADENRLVALKILHSHHSQDLSRRERFFRGAKKMAELRHPNVVAVFETMYQDEGWLFFVMEFVAGGNLEQAVLKGQLTRSQELAVLLQVGKALAFAHECGVVHRDIKPSNVLLDSGGVAKLTDFDLVRADDTTGFTATHAMLGTLQFAAPEALDTAAGAGVRADIYSLASTAVFLLLDGRLPSIYYRDPTQVVADLPVGASLRRVLIRATAFEPDRRFVSVEDLCKALAATWPTEETPSHH